MKLISKLFDSNDKEIKKLAPIVEHINRLEPEFKKLKDSDFPKKTAQLKKRIEDGESVFMILPEAFALVREASFRTLGMRHFDVQMMAATVLAQGKVAEQKTGEGKTMSAIPALFLHALTGNSVHLVTVNDYLARRDAGWMGAVFAFLGMSVSSIISGKSFIYDPEFNDTEARDYRLVHLKETTRADAYKANVIYGINSEFGFDYLRDNMVTEKSELVQTGQYFAVIDEVDSVLIDEARTPHIISAPDMTPSNKYYEIAKIIEKLNGETDYKIDEKQRTAHLTEEGLDKVEKLFGIQNIYEKDFDTVYHIEAALKARTLFHIDRDYIVRDGQVILVDEFTGRLMEGRRLSEGLHQAIEAKENVAVQRESKTLATISLQNYFRKYKVLAGMTGTAVTEAEEFHKIYGLDVVTIPTNKAQLRDDEPDLIYKTTHAKIVAIVDQVEKAHKTGQPVLVGTTSIDKNEIISQYLNKKKIPHQVLNAKNHLSEALIIAEAGRLGAVTVATNMAGRGVDIILGGQPPSSFEIEYQDGKGKKKFEEEIKKWQTEHDKVVDAGGLLVIGTEKHESRRIDNQLRGRSGRQGDPGKSVFVISLEDDLMRIFGGDQISGLMTRFNFPEDQPLTHGLVSRVITSAQSKVEGHNFESRKHLLEYDDVLNQQREIIYKMRREIVEQEEAQTGEIMEKVRETIAGIVMTQYNAENDKESNQKIIGEFATIVPFDEASQHHLFHQLEKQTNPEDKVEFLSKLAADIQKKREETYGKEITEKIAKVVTLTSIDNLWMDHLTSIDDLRTGINLRGYAQKDPLVEYKNEAFGMFERLIAAINDGVVSRFFRMNPAQAPAPEQMAKHMSTNQPESEVSEGHKSIKTIRKMSTNTGSEKSQKVSTKEESKLGRNDPCWCGSGKKFKKCHFPEMG